jgi:RNase P/RNase MRP subunit p29
MKHKNIGYGFIGSVVLIEESKNQTLIGLKGKVIDETKNTITLITNDEKIKKIIKNQVKIKKIRE